MIRTSLGFSFALALSLPALVSPHVLSALPSEPELRPLSLEDASLPPPDDCPNLLVNGDAESSLLGWTITDGYMESRLEGECEAGPPHSGLFHFIVGALCEDYAFSRGIQDVDIGDYATDVDADLAYLRFGGYLSNFEPDIPEMTLEFYDVNMVMLSAADTLSSATGSWELVQADVLAPSGTRTVRVVLTGTRYGGSDNDSYFDDLFLRIHVNN